MQRSQRPELNPFRPTLDRFADDPAELNVNTQMGGGAPADGTDIAEIADRLDRMQRDYLSQSQTQVKSAQGSRPAQMVMPQALDIQDLTHMRGQSGSNPAHSQSNGTMPLSAQGATPCENENRPSDPMVPSEQALGSAAVAISENNDTLAQLQKDNWVERQ